VGLVVGIDQGTSGTTVLALDADLDVRGASSRPVYSRHTGDGGVEQDPMKVLATVVEACGEALDGVTESIDAAGVAHQGETVIAWDPVTLEPLTPALVWSDRRAESVTRRLADRGFADEVSELSGMHLDPYFCAAKYSWMLEQVPGLAESAVSGRAHLGTLDTWLLRQLGAPLATDIGTASRTQLTRPGSYDWDPTLVDLFGLSADWLAPIGPSVTDRGILAHADWDFTLPLHAVLVDQPAALIGNGCLELGDVKVTYGTGAFVVANAGTTPPGRQSAVIPSVGWDDERGPVYMLDGGVLSVGSALDWLAGLGVDVSPEAHQRLAGRGPSSLVVAPAFVGTGAPRWNRGDTASISGITSATTGDDLLQAFLDSFAFRVAEIVEAIVATGIPRPARLRVDGGLTKSAYLMQRQADVLGVPLVVAGNPEATALGAALMASGEPTHAGREALQAASRIFHLTDGDESRRAFSRWVEAVDGLR
jgi:glycerol kinase